MLESNNLYNLKMVEKFSTKNIIKDEFPRRIGEVIGAFGFYGQLLKHRALMLPLNFFTTRHNPNVKIPQLEIESSIESLLRSELPDSSHAYANQLLVEAHRVRRNNPEEWLRIIQSISTRASEFADGEFKVGGEKNAFAKWAAVIKRIAR